jgi:hypothetical protein
MLRIEMVSPVFEVASINTPIEADLKVVQTTFERVVVAVLRIAGDEETC